MKNLIIYYLLIINLVSFILMYVDKVKAIKHQWRIKESTLLGFAICGGCIGSFLGMQIFRHKTKHPKFYIGIPVIMIIEIILSFYLFLEF
ncbi:MAG: DUF1294 domain-containing protein [Sarcina sp.]